MNGYLIAGDTNGSPASFEQDFALVALNAEAVNGGNPIAPVASIARDPDVPTTVDVSWTTPTNLMLVEYEVWRGTNLGNFQCIGTTTALSWHDTALASDTTYIYRIVAKGGGNTSATSNKVLATSID